MRWQDFRGSDNVEDRRGEGGGGGGFGFPGGGAGGLGIGTIVILCIIGWVTGINPAVLIGGAGPTVLDRVLSHGDGWIPLRIGPDDLRPFADRVAELQRRAGEQGRGPLDVTVYGGVADASALASYADAGVHRVLFELPDAETTEVLRELDRLAGLLRP